jgi:hypothetical protein
VHGTAEMDPELMLKTHLDLVLRGLQVRPDEPPANTRRKGAVKPAA